MGFFLLLPSGIQLTILSFIVIDPFDYFNNIDYHLVARYAPDYFILSTHPDIANKGIIAGIVFYYTTIILVVFKIFLYLFLAHATRKQRARQIIEVASSIKNFGLVLVGICLWAWYHVARTSQQINTEKEFLTIFPFSFILSLTMALFSFFIYGYILKLIYLLKPKP